MFFAIKLKLGWACRSIRKGIRRYYFVLPSAVFPSGFLRVPLFFFVGQSL